MHVVAAPNALKGTIDAPSAARLIAEGARRADPNVVVTELPVADGGDGTRGVLVAAQGGTTHELEVEDALGRKVRACWSRLPDGSAVLDVASASGLARLAASELDVMRASSYGTGQLLRAALDAGATRVILGVGGSATVDGGAGLLEALGVHLLDGDGELVPRGGRGLGSVTKVDRSAAHPALGDCELIVACDVTTPFVDAARLYGPQKGASAEQVVELTRNLAHLAGVLGLGELPRGGAAGGIAAGLHAVLGAKLVSGIDLVLDLIGFDEKVRGADLVITAEGRFDETSAARKGPWGVAERAAALGVPTVLLAGCVSAEMQGRGRLPFAGVFPLEDSLAVTAERVARLFL
jgi:glycerate kinase